MPIFIARKYAKIGTIIKISMKKKRIMSELAKGDLKESRLSLNIKENMPTSAARSKKIIGKRTAISKIKGAYKTGFLEKVSKLFLRKLKYVSSIFN